jgi:hypothetical protein
LVSHFPAFSVIRKDKASCSWSWDGSQGTPGIQHPRDGRFNIRASEKGMGQGLEAASWATLRSAAKRRSRRAPDMPKEGVAPQLAMEHAPAGDSVRAVEGAI